ncbi:hypothetical protein J1N35_005192 [Gossypium stocksii]|uniref:Uncharacterized protein n=1 Tax=Gossypium stocksii TaxID=47602 RepID=A0A9D3WE46_9ROSI|nr:hypothetical protein J1N35_005192 [Gossypium stocksii]
MEASNGQSEERSGRVPVEIENVISTPKFKRRRVSAVRDFSPGYRRVTASNFGLSRQIAIDQSSQGSDTRELLVLYMIRCATVYPISVDRHKLIWCVYL